MTIEKVLVVDDSPTDAHLLTSILLMNGYSPITASSGEDALRVAKDEHPDLILMDIVMPGMNGFQATRALNKDPETSHIPIVIISSKDQPTDKLWGIRQGAKDYISKPIDESVLLKKIQSL